MPFCTNIAKAVVMQMQPEGWGAKIVRLNFKKLSTEKVKAYLIISDNFASLPSFYFWPCLCYKVSFKLTMICLVVQSILVDHSSSH